MDKHSEIAERAYLIWEQKGYPENRALECWLEAERDLNAAETVREHLERTLGARRVQH